MQYLGTGFTVILLWVNLWGLGLATGLFWRNRWLALSVGPWLWATVFFAIETHWGLGSLRGLGSVATVGALGLIVLSNTKWLPNRLRGLDGWLQGWREEFNLVSAKTCLFTFGGLFLYVFAWRWAFPSIDGSAEKIADLSFISSYLVGGTIPVADAWLYPYRFTQYYSFQHYSGALLGRMFGFSPGETYNYAFCVLNALAALAFAGGVSLLARRNWVKIMLVVGFVVGGSGVSGLTPLFFQDAKLWNSQRFIGTEPYSQAPVGTWLKEYADNYPTVELSGEWFSYSVSLGDYHAPLAGFYLLALGVLSVVLAERTKLRRYTFLVGATLTWTVMANTWSFPLQLMAVGAWCMWNRSRWRVDWPMVVLGAAATWLAAAIYLKIFTVAASEYQNNLRWVSSELHAPWLLFTMYMLPTIGLAVLAFYSRSRALLGLGLLALAYLAFSELFYIDDVYEGAHERFNATLKWWPWIATWVLLVLGPLLIDGAKQRWVRVLAIILCAYPSLYAWELGRYWLLTPKFYAGRMEGDGYLRRDEPAKQLLERLKLEPYGAVIERTNRDSFTDSSYLPLFAGKPMWLGWSGHEALWRGYPSFVWQRLDRLERFFKGEITGNDADWKSERISYVLWYQPADTEELWLKLNEAIQKDYEWCVIYITPDGKRVGFWRLRSMVALNTQVST
ncbi:DUF2298 domain-containing protein [Rariglobus hedericola]|uniref:Chlor_Arch_YYY domain-containing protein n=1 Tax=Rariglobus hedericola TaxID=2597822 RepID=A0A556QNF8_9BACT|nr:DUF2298 domain-containing protein [Rariglobus hedericola]TSJ78188.1 hypothetical protein FPL22_02450 [Rariglobus hedericola]